MIGDGILGVIHRPEYSRGTVMTLATPVEPNIAVAPSNIRDEPLYEVIQGQRVELLPMGAYETDIAFVLGAYLWHFASANKLGRVEVEMLFRLALPDSPERRPDVAFVSYQRWPHSRKIPRTPAWEVTP